MPPDAKRTGPEVATPQARPNVKATGKAPDTSNLPPGAVGGRECAWCHGPLAPRRKRFCCDLCRIRGQKAERRYDDADYTSGVRRLVAAQGRRAGADLPMFVLFAESVDYARARLADAADQLIDQGYSYTDIGAALGITRQAAWKRFGRKPEVDAGTPESGAAG